MPAKGHCGGDESGASNLMGARVPRLSHAVVADKAFRFVASFLVASSLFSAIKIHTWILTHFDAGAMDRKISSSIASCALSSSGFGHLRALFGPAFVTIRFKYARFDLYLASLPPNGTQEPPSWKVQLLVLGHDGWIAVSRDFGAWDQALQKLVVDARGPSKSLGGGTECNLQLLHVLQNPGR